MVYYQALGKGMKLFNIYNVMILQFIFMLFSVSCGPKNKVQVPHANRDIPSVEKNTTSRDQSRSISFTSSNNSDESNNSQFSSSTSAPMENLSKLGVIRIAILGGDMYFGGTNYATHGIKRYYHKYGN